MARTLKHSKQRDAIYSLLASVKSHPTAEWLYTELKKEYPNLSLATVYRNLNLLCDTGDIIKLDIGDGSEHFDATVQSHCHFICKNCSCVTDVVLPSLCKLDKEAAQLNDISVEGSSIVFYGLCHSCK